MARKLTGSNRQAKNGRWYPKLKNMSLGGFDTEEEAQAVLDLAIAQAAKKASGAMTLSKFADTFFAERRGRGVSGLDKEINVWNNWVEPHPIAHMPLKSIRPRHAREFIDFMSTQKKRVAKRKKVGGVWQVTAVELDGLVSRQVLVHALGKIKLAMQLAVDKGLLDVNHVRDVKIPTRRDQVSTDSGQLVPYLDSDEVERLIAAARNSRSPVHPAIYTLAIFSGLRWGEICGLRWDDLVLEGPAPMIQVRRSYAGPTKTKGSRRDVPMFERVRVELLALRDRQGVRRARGLVFPSKSGGVRRPDDKFAWHRLLKSAGITRKFIRKWTRHTCASHLVMGTWTHRPMRLEEVRDWMGHSDLKTTQRYAHLSPQGLKSLVSTPEARKGKAGALHVVSD